MTSKGLEHRQWVNVQIREADVEALKLHAKVMQGGGQRFTIKELVEEIVEVWLQERYWDENGCTCRYGEMQDPRVIR